MDSIQSPQKKMRPSFSNFFLISLFFIFAFRAIIANNLIHETCKTCAQNDPNVGYNFCVTSLQPAPDSSCANVRKLGLISIKLIRQNVTDTKRYVKQLLNNENLDPYIRACLKDCLELYSDAIPTAAEAMKNYKEKHYGDANIELSSVMDASTTCEDGFKEKEAAAAVSPMTKRNNDTFQLSAIGLSIINMLH